MGKFSGTTEAIEEGRGEICDSILRSLPLWFGIEQAIVDYSKTVESLPTLIARIDGRIAGFISIEFHNSSTSEIHVMAVREEFHRKGVGQALVLAAEEHSRKRGAEIFMVKTLGPSRPNREYDQTRQFYLSQGFRPLEELKTLWSEGNPCLIMVKPLAKLTAAKLHHVEYYVNDLERARTFWTWLFEVLGWKHRETWKDGFDWLDPDTGAYLVIVQVKEEHLHFKNNRQAQGLNHIALSVNTKCTQATLVRDLQQRGATIIYDEPNYVCFEDPSQIGVELYLEADATIS